MFLAAAVGWLVLAAAAAGVVASYQAGLRLRGRRLAGFLAGAALVLAGGVLIGLEVGGVRRMTTAASGNVLMLAVCLVGLPLVFGLWVRARRDTARRPAGPGRAAGTRAGGRAPTGSAPRNGPGSPGRCTTWWRTGSR